MRHDVAPTGARLDPRDPRARVDLDLSVVELEPEQECAAEVGKHLAEMAGPAVVDMAGMLPPAGRRANPARGGSWTVAGPADEGAGRPGGSLI